MNSSTELLGLWGSVQWSLGDHWTLTKWPEDRGGVVAQGKDDPTEQLGALFAAGEKLNEIAALLLVVAGANDGEGRRSDIKTRYR